MKASDKKLPLTVTTLDESAEFFIIDGRFQVVERFRGQTNTFSLAPGIYTAKIKVGSQSDTQDVVLRDKPETIIFTRLQFPSAAPLEDTGQTHEYHIAAAEAESQKVHVSIGSGSSIFFFVRDWKPGEETDKQINPRPQVGLQLLDTSGNVLVDLDQKAKFDPSRDPSAACNVQVNPGIYRLALHLQSGSVIEQTVVASDQWQTQVFLLQRNYGKDRTDRRADLSGASILMSKSGFSANDANKRLVETARLGLIDTRQLLSDTVIDHMLWGKYDNPMLGILGAHLLLLADKPKMDVLREVVTNLRRLLGENKHPDVEALALRLGEKSSFVFDQPPMLRRSWWQVVDATVDKTDLVPLGSTAATAAQRIWGEEPWLQWKTLAETRVEAASMPFGLADQPALAREKIELRNFGDLYLHSDFETPFGLDDVPDVYPPKRAKSSSSKRTAKSAKKISGLSEGGSSSKLGGKGASTAESPTTKPRLNKSAIRKMVKASGLPFANLQAMYDQFDFGAGKKGKS